MAENTEISWATHTFNPWWGCAKQSPACRFCYADRDSKRWGMQIWGVNAERKMMGDDTWRKPLKWNREASASPDPVRVFCASMADVFDEHPACVEPRARLWRLIEDTPALTWMLLTKRPQNAAAMVPDGWQRDGWPGHVWCGVSAETQKFADQRIPILRELKATIRFVSAAPLLGPLNLAPYLKIWRPLPGAAYEPCYGDGHDLYATSLINWVITEGESGPKARPSHPDWFRSIRDQCATAGVAYHHKQWGEWAPKPATNMHSHESRAGWYHSPDRHVVVDAATGATKLAREFTGTEPASSAFMFRVGKKAAGRELDGRVWDEYPRLAASGRRSRHTAREAS